MKIYCIKCKGFTNHEVLATVSKSYTPENTPDLMIDFANATWEIMGCNGCEEVTFRETWLTSEDRDWDTHIPEPITKLFPPRGTTVLPIRSHYSLSPILRQIYRETIDCYNQGLNTLCAMGIRILIEGICADKGIKDGPVTSSDGVNKRKANLQGKIEGMTERGFLTKEHAQTLHELRFLGNEAAHELKTPGSDELQLAIELLELTLDNLYELTEKAEMLRWKKKIRS